MWGRLRRPCWLFPAHSNVCLQRDKKESLFAFSLLAGDLVGARGGGGNGGLPFGTREQEVLVLTSRVPAGEKSVDRPEGLSVGVRLCVALSRPRGVQRSPAPKAPFPADRRGSPLFCPARHVHPSTLPCLFTPRCSHPLTCSASFLVYTPLPAERGLHEEGASSFYPHSNLGARAHLAEWSPSGAWPPDSVLATRALAPRPVKRAMVSPPRVVGPCEVSRGVRLP